MITLFKQLAKDQRRTLLACFFAFFVSGIFTLMMGSVLPDMKAAYQLSDTQSGLMLSAHSIGNLIAGFVSGLVPLLLGRRRSIVALSAFAGLGFLMMLLWGNPIFLILCFIFTGIGRGSISNFNNGTVSIVSGGSPVASNLLHAVFAIGAFSAPMIFLLLGGQGNWRTALLCVVALCCLSVFCFSRLRLEDDRPDPKDKANSTMVFLKNPSFLILGMMMFFYLCAEFSINGWLVTYLQNKEALLTSFPENTEAAIRAYSQSMATLLWVVILAGRLTCAVLATKVPQKTLMLVASIGVVGFFTLMLLGSSIAVVTISISGLGFCMAGICPMIYSDAGIFSNTYSMATSTLLAIGSSGAILMPAIVGATADAFGFAGGMATILVMVVLLLVCAILNVTVKTRIPPEQAEKQRPGAPAPIPSEI